MAGKLTREHRLFGISLAVFAAASAAAIGTASARGGLNDAEIGEIIEQNSSFAVGVAHCEVGDVVGGGIVQSGSGEDLVLRSSGPVDETDTMEETRDGDTPSGWFAAVSSDTNTSHDLRIYSICSDSAVNAKIEVKRFEAPSGVDNKRASAKCPGKRRALSGGAIQAGQIGLSFITESGPIEKGGSFSSTNDGDVPRAWSARIANQGSEYFKALAVCVPRDADSQLSGFGSKAVIEATPFQTDEADTWEDGTALCPDGRLALGGGILHKAAGEGRYAMTVSGPLGASDDPTDGDFTSTEGDQPLSWYSGLRTIFGTPIGKFKALAVCEPAGPS
jgi:hypothetical protein